MVPAMVSLVVGGLDEAVRMILDADIAAEVRFECRRERQRRRAQREFVGQGEGGDALAAALGDVGISAAVV